MICERAVSVLVRGVKKALKSKKRKSKAEQATVVQKAMAVHEQQLDIARLSDSSGYSSDEDSDYEACLGSRISRLSLQSNTTGGVSTRDGNHSSAYSSASSSPCTTGQVVVRHPAPATAEHRPRRCSQCSDRGSIISTISSETEFSSPESFATRKSSRRSELQVASHSSRQRHQDASTHHHQPALPVIPDVNKPSSHTSHAPSSSQLSVTRGSTTKAPRSLTQKNALRCFAVSVWAHLSKSLQARLDAEDIAKWLQASEEALFAADWQQEALLTPACMALLHRMIRELMNAQHGRSAPNKSSGRLLCNDAALLKSTILACLYVICSYSGQEITYPSWPFQACSTETFWSQTISYALQFSRDLLLMHRDPEEYLAESDLMAEYACIDIRQCRSHSTKCSVPDSVAELLLEAMEDSEKDQIFI